jgi:hypothetical protein
LKRVSKKCRQKSIRNKETSKTFHLTSIFTQHKRINVDFKP